MPIFEGLSPEHQTGGGKKKKPPKPPPSYTTPSEGRGGYSSGAPSTPYTGTPDPNYSTTGSSSSYSAPSYYAPPSRDPKTSRTPPTTLDSIIQEFKLKGPQDLHRGSKPDEPELTSNLGDFFEQIQKNVHDVAQGKIRDTGASDGFLKKLREINQTKDRMPRGQEINLPERYMHQGQNKNRNLKWYWDKEVVNETLKDYREAGDDFNYDYYMSQVLDARYKDKEQFAFQRTKNRSDKIADVLQEATDLLYPDDEGKSDPGFLQNYMEDHPNFELDPLRFREDFGITSNMLRREMDKRLEGVEDPEQRAEIRSHYQGYAGAIPTYNKIQENYALHNEIVNNRINSFMERYKDMTGEDFETPDEMVDEPENPLLEDFAEDKAEFFRLDRKGQHRARQRVRKDIELELDMQGELPSIKQMLMMQVNAGVLDPNDEEAVDDMMLRLRNPAHPDTRGMYASVALTRNPNLTEDEALEFINRPFMKYVKGLQRKEENAAMDERIAEVEDYEDVTGVGDFFSDVWNVGTKRGLGVDSVPRDISDSGKRALYRQDEDNAYHEYVTGGEGNAAGKGLGWTLDKLLRFNYASAGFSNAYLNRQEADAGLWESGNPKDLALAVGLSTMEGGRAAYDQFFRGSDLPNVDDVDPMTYANVLENQGVDNPWIKHGTGFVLDVALDPTTYVGVGVIGAGAKLSVRGTKGLAQQAIRGVEASGEKYLSRLYGKELGESWRLNRQAQRSVLNKRNWVSRLNNPELSKTAQHSWRARKIISAPKGSDALPPLGPEATVKEIEAQLQELGVRQNALNNDLAVDGLRDHLRNFYSIQGEYTPRPDMADARVERVLGVIEGQGSTGLLHRISQQAKEVALERGFSRTNFKYGPEGDAARAASSEIDELTTRFPDGGPAFDARKAELEGTVSKGTGEPTPDYDRMFADEGMEFSRGAEIRAVLSKAMNIPEETLSKMFTDRELLEAAVRGPQLRRASNGEAKAKYNESFRLLTKSQATLRSLEDRGVTATSDPRVRRATLAATTALRSLDEESAAGTLSFLQQLDRMGPLQATDSGLVRVSENAVYSNPEAGKHLTQLRDAVVKARMRNNNDLGVKEVPKEHTPVVSRSDSDAPIKPVTPGSASNAKAVDALFDPLTTKNPRTPKTKSTVEKEKGFKVSPEAAPKGKAAGPKVSENDYADELIDRDWSTMTPEDVLREFNNDAGLEIAQRSIEGQLKKMRLDAGGRIKGLPGAEADRLRTAAPRQFLTDGKVDPDKLSKVFRVDLIHKGTKDERYAVRYDVPEGMDAEGMAFLRNFGQTLQDRYNTKYLDLNLQAKSDVTGINITDKAQHVFEGKGPRHAVVLGVGRNHNWLEFARKRMGDNAKSLRSDREVEYGGALTGYQQANQKIHQAIKESDETGIPPVVYIFTNKSMDNEANRFLKINEDYAKTRGVSVVTINMSGDKPKSTIWKGNQPHESKVADTPAKHRLMATGNFKRSTWARNFPEGFSSARALQDAAMESGTVDDFYNVLLAPGFPGNLTDRSFLQADDVIKGRMDEGVVKADDFIREDALPALHYKGERMPYNVRKARKRMADRGAQRNEIEDVIFEWAGHVKAYVDSLPPKAQTKLFHDIFNGSKAAAAKDAERQAAQAAARSKGIAQRSTEDARLSPVGEDILGASTYNKLRDDALRESIDDLAKEINTRGSLPASAAGVRARYHLPLSEQELSESVGRIYGSALSGSTRRTVNESARDVVREIKAEWQIKRADAELDRILASTAAEKQAITDTIEGLERSKAKALKEVEVARKQALVAKKTLRQDDLADALIQTTFWPGKQLSGDAARQLIEAKKLDLETPANKLLEPEVAAEAAAHRYYKIRADSWTHRVTNPDNFVRPSKQLTTPEGREILARMTGSTPVIVKSAIETIDRRMGGMMKENRKASFQAYLTGNRYTGGQPEYVQGINDEMNELAAIWNGEHGDYRFTLENRPGAYSFVTWNDLAHWLPDGYVPDFKLLGRLKKKNGGKVKISHVWEAMGPNKPKEAYDPAVFAHTMRVAANQAADYRVSVNAINRTFGVPRVVTFDRSGDDLGLKTQIMGTRVTPESTQVEGLSKLGWETIDELGNTHYFHPAAVNEVRTLVRLLNDRDLRTKFGKTVDTALSAWKGLHTTYSPPYYVRNLVGETLMAWMGGVSNPKYYTRAARGIQFLRGPDVDLADLVRQLPALKNQFPIDVVKGSQHAFTLRSGLKGDYKTAWALYTEHGLKSTFTNTEVRTHGARAGTGALFSDRAAMRKMKQGFNKLHNFGEYAEDYVRFAHFLHALEHSKKGSLEGAAMYAAQRVRKYHFDYSDVSTFEKVAVGRAWPFFKWTRFAAPVMLSHMFLTPGRVTAPNKFMGNLTNAINSGTLNSDDMYDATHGHLPNYNGMGPSWVRDLFAYQVGGMPDGDDSYAQYIRFATPQIDALSQVWQPKDTAITLLNPALKAAWELSQNKSADPDMGDLKLYGSDFHDMYGINNAEAMGLYATRQLGPFAKTAGQMWMNQQETEDGQSYGDYREEQGYNPWMQMVSNLSGASIYQVNKNQNGSETATDTTPKAQPPVGSDDLKRFLGSAERPNLPTKGDKNNGYEQTQQDLPAGYSPAGSAESGWQNFWNNFSGYSGFGGFGGGYSSGGVGYGGSTSVGDAPWGDILMQLIASMKDQIDQGRVTD